MTSTPAAADSGAVDPQPGPTDRARPVIESAELRADAAAPIAPPQSPQRSAAMPPVAAGQRGAAGIGLSSLMAAMGIEVPDAPPRPGGSRSGGLDHLAQFDWAVERARRPEGDEHSSDGLLFDVHLHAFGCGDTLSDNQALDRLPELSHARHRPFRAARSQVGAGAAVLGARDPERSAEFVVSFATGRASALFFDAMISGEALMSVVIAACTNDGQQYLRLELSDVLVCSYDQLPRTVAHRARLDTFALDYAALSYTYFPRYGDHAFGPPSAGSWVNPRRLG